MREYFEQTQSLDPDEYEFASAQAQAQESGANGQPAAASPA